MFNHQLDANTRNEKLNKTLIGEFANYCGVSAPSMAELKLPTLMSWPKEEINMAGSHASGKPPTYTAPPTIHPTTWYSVVPPVQLRPLVCSLILLPD